MLSAFVWIYPRAKTGRNVTSITRVREGKKNSFSAGKGGTNWDDMYTRQAEVDLFSLFDTGANDFPDRLHHHQWMKRKEQQRPRNTPSLTA